jgi:hypothetical protein
MNSPVFKDALASLVSIIEGDVKMHFKNTRVIVDGASRRVSILFGQHVLWESLWQNDYAVILDCGEHTFQFRNDDQCVMAHWLRFPTEAIPNRKRFVK